MDTKSVLDNPLHHAEIPTNMKEEIIEILSDGTLKLDFFFRIQISFGPKGCKNGSICNTIFLCQFSFCYQNTCRAMLDVIEVTKTLNRLKNKKLMTH